MLTGASELGRHMPLGFALGCIAGFLFRQLLCWLDRPSKQADEGDDS